MMDFDRMAARSRQIRRGAVARSVLDQVALMFLGCSMLFWCVAFWQLLTPPAPLSLGTISVMVLAVVYSLAAPLLLSMLVPTTPAGQLLQKTQWATIGFPVIVAAALFLSYEGFVTIAAWLSAQGAVDEASGQHILVATHMVTPMAISLTIAFVLIPALAWVQVTPERWLQQIQQAHQVKKLEMQQRGELAIIKARLLWAEQKAAVSFANLLPAERQEIIDTIGGLFRAIGDTQRDIARTLQIDADLTRSILDDEQVAEQLDYVAEALTAQNAAPATPRSLPAEREADQWGSHQSAAPVERGTGRDGTGAPAPQRPAAPRSAPQRYAKEYDLAFYGLTGAWTVHALADVLGVHERTARDRLNAWIEQGLAVPAETKGRFSFTESEAR